VAVAEIAQKVALDGPAQTAVAVVTPALAEPARLLRRLGGLYMPDITVVQVRRELAPTALVVVAARLLLEMVEQIRVVVATVVQENKYP